MSPKVYSARHQDGNISSASVATGPIFSPPRDVEAVKADCDSLTFDQFTVDDAWTLGTLLRARLSPLATAAGGGNRPTLVSISLANSQQVVFQCAVGSGVSPDNEVWVARKRNTVLRWGCSSWLMGRKYAGDEALFAAKNGMDGLTASKYAIHGGGVPVRVRGVEGIVAVVVVSGLKQDEDHGVIIETVRGYWKEV